MARILSSLQASSLHQFACADENRWSVPGAVAEQSQMARGSIRRRRYFLSLVGSIHRIVLFSKDPWIFLSPILVKQLSTHAWIQKLLAHAGRVLALLSWLMSYLATVVSVLLKPIKMEDSSSLRQLILSWLGVGLWMRLGTNLAADYLVRGGGHS